MGFKEVVSLDCDNAISLGGTDRKTRKDNPTRIEGYFVGSRKVDSAKAKSGFCLLHVFQTAKGLTGVWGKTDLDRKLASATPGAMTRVTFTGMKETKNNPMYVYKVEVDAENTIDVSSVESSAGEDSAEDYSSNNYGEEEELAAGEDEEAVDEVPPARAQPPRQAAAAPSAAQQARVKSLLGGKTRSA